MLPALGAWLWASGSQLCSGTLGSFGGEADEKAEHDQHFHVAVHAHIEQVW